MKIIKTFIAADVAQNRMLPKKMDISVVTDTFLKKLVEVEAL